MKSDRLQEMDVSIQVSKNQPFRDKNSRTSTYNTKIHKEKHSFFLNGVWQVLSVCHFDEFLICNRFFAEIVQVQCRKFLLYATIFSYLKPDYINSKMFLEKCDFVVVVVSSFLFLFFQLTTKPTSRSPLYIVNILLLCPQSFRFRNT